MAFFDTLANKSKDVAEKAKKLAEVTSLNSQISSKESGIKNVYYEIGKIICDNKETWKEVDLEPQFTKIAALEEEIEKLKAEILVVKGVKICTQCGAEIDAEVAFCPQCGAQAPKVEPAEEKKADINIEPATNAEVEDIVVEATVVEETPVTEENTTTEENVAE